MPRIEKIRLKIRSGAQGADQPVRIKFNGFEIPLAVVSGGAEAGGAFEGEYRVASMGHSCSLLGPKAAPWAIDALNVRYEYGAGIPPDSWDFPARVLSPGEDVNILEKPPASFDV